MSSEKKSGQSTANFEKCSVVLVDVLGTTTSINFAKDTLFPYVIKNAEEVLKEKWDSDDVKSAVKQLKEGEELDCENAIKLVKDLTEKSSDNPGLKSLQGIIYERGYENGDLKAHVFPDVPGSFETWAKSRKVAIYSTGSVDSQKLVFAKSTEGDLSSHISKYFDQTVGPKTEADSYKKIVEELSVKPEEVLFITDLTEEGKAAKEAGLSVALITREGNAELPEESKDFSVISSFTDITFENPSKRKVVEEPAVTEEPPSKVAKTDEAADVEPVQEQVEEKKSNDKEAVEDEAMEVDAVAPEITAPASEEVKPIEPETEKATESIQKTEEETSKTELKPVTEDSTMTEVTSELTPPKDEIPEAKQKSEETVDSTEKSVDSTEEPSKTEEKTIEDKHTEAEVKEEDAKDAKDVTEPVKCQQTEEVKEKVEVNSTNQDKNVKEAKPAEDKVDEGKSEEIVKTSEVESVDSDKPEESEKEVTTEEPKVEKETVEAPSEVVNEVTDAPEKTEKPVESTEANSEVTSSDEKPASVAETAAAASTAEVKTADEEKENRKDLANGLENGQKEDVDEKEASNGESTEEVKVNGDTKAEENGTAESSELALPEEKVPEIKTKKAEPETPAVSVEV